MKHIQLFESFNTPSLNVGDVVFIKPNESEFSVVAVDPKEALKIERSIMVFDPTYQGSPIRLEVTDPNKNYVVWDVSYETARLITQDKAHQLNQTGYYMGAFLEDGELDWADPIDQSDEEMGMSDSDYWAKQKEIELNPKYIVPVVKNKIVFIDGHGSLMFIDEPIEQFYEGR